MSPPAPVISNMSPPNGAMGISTVAPISFDLTNPNPYVSGTLLINFSDYFIFEDVSDQITGTNSLFESHYEYAKYSMEIWYNQTLVSGTVTEANPAIGTFYFSSPSGPIIPAIGESVIISYIRNFHVSSVDMTGLGVTIGGVPAVIDGIAQPGYACAITPSEGAMHVEVTHSTEFPIGGTVNIIVTAQDLTFPTPSIMTPPPWSFDTAGQNIVPYITEENPANGTLGVSASTNIYFKIKTDNGASITLASVNVYLNGIPILLGGIEQDHTNYPTTLSSISKGCEITIDPAASLPIQTYKIDADAVDNTSAHGYGYFEFATNTFDFLFEISSKLPVACPYDYTSNPYLITDENVVTNRNSNDITSANTYWNAKKYDIIQLQEGNSSGDMIADSFVNTSATLYEKPRGSTSNSWAKSYTPNKFSPSNPVRSITNRNLSYSLMKLWGSTRMRYLTGYPSDVNMPISYSNLPLATRFTYNTGIAYFDDTTLKTSGLVKTATQKYLNFGVVSSGVTSVSYDRYSLMLGLPITGVTVGSRCLVQFSVSSMDDKSDFYVGLANTAASPKNDLINLSGATFRRIIGTGTDEVYITAYYGGQASVEMSSGISYLDFINRMFLGEIEVTDPGSAIFRLYDFENDLVNPIFTTTALRGSRINADRISLTSFGSSEAASGAKVEGSLYYADFEVSPSPFVPYVVSSDIDVTTAKWRPYSNVVPLTCTESTGIKTIYEKLATANGGVSTTTQRVYHVLDSENTITSIDSLTPANRISVLPVEDPTTIDSSSSNANMYRRASLVYRIQNDTAGIIFLSKDRGSLGNGINVEMVNPGPNSTLQLNVIDRHVEIILATDSSSVVTSTIQDITDLIDASATSPIWGIAVGIASTVAEPLSLSLLFGGTEYKSSTSSRFSEIALMFRSNKTGTYFVTANDSGTYKSIGNATLYEDGTVVTSTPLFQPNDLGTSFTITNAANPSNNGPRTIIAVMGASLYPTNTIMLDRTDFVKEVNTFTWELGRRTYLLASGKYDRIGYPKAVSFFTQDLSNLPDTTRRINVTICKNMLISEGALIECVSSILIP